MPIIYRIQCSINIPTLPLPYLQLEELPRLHSNQQVGPAHSNPLDRALELTLRRDAGVSTAHRVQQQELGVGRVALGLAPVE